MICQNCFSYIQESGICQICGYTNNQATVNESILPPMFVLNNRYRIGRTLGIGGFGITYVAQDMTNGTRCAIKELMPTQIAYREGTKVFCSQSDGAIFEHCKENFLAEAKMLQQVGSNPSVVKVQDSFYENNTAYIVMELLVGETLRDKIKKFGGSLDYTMATEMLLLTGSALMTIHEKGILHRDISPENIFCTLDNDYKLIDFGASRYYVSEKSQSLSIYLKPGFAPPEQYSSKGNQGPWTDVYGLAATYYYTLTGNKLADTMDRLSGVSYLSLREAIPGCPVKTSDAVDKALTLDYRKRYQTVSEFLSDLDLSQMIASSNVSSSNVMDKTDLGIRKSKNRKRIPCLKRIWSNFLKKNK